MKTDTKEHGQRLSVVVKSLLEENICTAKELVAWSGLSGPSAIYKYRDGESEPGAGWFLAVYNETDNAEVRSRLGALLVGPSGQRVSAAADLTEPVHGALTYLTTILGSIRLYEPWSHMDRSRRARFLDEAVAHMGLVRLARRELDLIEAVIEVRRSEDAGRRRARPLPGPEDGGADGSDGGGSG